MSFTIRQSVLFIMKMSIERFLTFGTDKMLHEKNVDNSKLILKFCERIQLRIVVQQSSLKQLKGALCNDFDKLTNFKIQVL